MESGQYLKFLSHLKINVAKKNLFFKITLNKRELYFAQLLKQRGIIRRFFDAHTTQHARKMYIIYPNHTRFSNSNLRLVLFSRNADQIQVSLKALLLMNAASGGSSFLLKTDRGLPTHQEAIKQRVGGILFGLIY
jgi:ribosomal protein S8